MEKWKIYLELSGLDDKLKSNYRELREHFQELGFSQDDLNDPPTYTSKMMNSMESMQHHIKTIKRELKSFFDISDEEINQYIKDELQKIDEEIPLQ
jgi:hypothetical protein